MALTIRTFRFLTETKLHCNGGCAHHTAIHCTTKLTRRHRHVSLLLLGDATVAIGTHLPTKLDLPKLRVLLCNGKYRNLSAPATAMSPCRLAGRLFVAQKFQDSRPGLTAQLVQSPAWDSSLPPSKQWIRKYLAPDNTWSLSWHAYCCNFGVSTVYLSCHVAIGLCTHFFHSLRLSLVQALAGQNKFRVKQTTSNRSRDSVGPHFKTRRAHPVGCRSQCGLDSRT